MTDSRGERELLGTRTRHEPVGQRECEFRGFCLELTAARPQRRDQRQRAHTLRVADGKLCGDDGAEAMPGDERLLELEEVAHALERVHVTRDRDRCDRHLRATEAREVGSEDASGGGESRQGGEPRPPAPAEPMYEEHRSSDCTAERGDVHPATVDREGAHVLGPGDDTPVWLVFATVVGHDLLVHRHGVEG